MKKCTICGKELPDELSFCTDCGSPLTVSSEPVAEEIPVQEEVTEFTTDLPVQEYSYAEPVSEKKSNKKKLIIILSAATGLIALVLIIGALTNWFGTVSPLMDIYDAAIETISADSITAEIEIKRGSETERSKIKLVLDKDEEEVIYYLESDGKEQLYADGRAYSLYDDYAYISDNNDYDADKEFFDIYNPLIGEGEDFDLEETFEDLGLDEYIDYEDAEDFLESFYFDNLCDEDWLEEYLGFEEDDGVYTFSPDIADLTKELCDILIDSDILPRDLEKELKSVKNEALDELDVNEYKFTLSITVEGGEITDIEADMKEGESTYSFNISFTDIDDTEISEEEIEEFTEDVEDFIEENTCSQCGETLWYVENREQHGDCDDCGSHQSSLKQYDTGWYCDDCYDDLYYGSYYDDYGYCDRCGDYARLYDYSYSRSYCWDCYYYYYY